jgi:hypothetical protein
MSGRKIILDVTDLPRPQPRVACPACGAALSSVDPLTLRPIAINIFRYQPSQHPRAFEARCGGCGRLLVVLKRGPGLELAGADQNALLKWIHEAEREEVALRDGSERELRRDR